MYSEEEVEAAGSELNYSDVDSSDGSELDDETDDDMPWVDQDDIREDNEEINERNYEGRSMAAVRAAVAARNKNLLGEADTDDDELWVDLNSDEPGMMMPLLDELLEDDYEPETEAEMVRFAETTEMQMNLLDRLNRTLPPPPVDDEDKSDHLVDFTEPDNYSHLPNLFDGVEDEVIPAITPLVEQVEVPFVPETVKSKPGMFLMFSTLFKPRAL